MNLQMVFVADNYVFSHSGIVKRWLEKNCDVSGGFMAAIEKLNNDCRKVFVLDTETKELREYGT